MHFIHSKFIPFVGDIFNEIVVFEICPSTEIIYIDQKQEKYLTMKNDGIELQ